MNDFRIFLRENNIEISFRPQQGLTIMNSLYHD